MQVMFALILCYVCLIPRKATKRNPIVHKRHNSKTRSAVVKVTIRHWPYNNYHGSICNRILCKGSSTSCYVIPIVKPLSTFPYLMLFFYIEMHVEQKVNAYLGINVYNSHFYKFIKCKFESTVRAV